MAPPPSSLYTLSFALALLATLLVASTLRLLAILPRHPFRPPPLRSRTSGSRILIVLGSGGHTHEMFQLLRDLDTRKWTHRTYIISSGDAFSAQRAAEFEAELERKAKEEQASTAVYEKVKEKRARKQCVGPTHYNIHMLPRARKIHQSLLTTPFSAVHTFVRSFAPLLSAPPLPSTPKSGPKSPYDRARADIPHLVLANGPATAVLVIYAAFVLRFFDWRGAQSRGLCRTVYVESFARVTTLSLSAKLVRGVVDRFLVQWEELVRDTRGEYFGILV